MALEELSWLDRHAVEVESWESEDKRGPNDRETGFEKQNERKPDETSKAVKAECVLLSNFKRMSDKKGSRTW